MKEKIKTLSDFESLIERLMEKTSEENVNSTLVFPLRRKSRWKIETSPYVILLTKSRSDLIRYRQSISSVYAKSNKRRENALIGNVTGRTLVNLLGVVFTRGILPEKYSILVERWSLHVNIVDQCDPTTQTQDLQAPIQPRT
jgi:hypothetical protein